MKRQAFTLVELLIVVVLMSILSATGITVYIDSAKDAKVQQTAQTLLTVQRAIHVSRLHHGVWPLGSGTDVTVLDEFVGASFMKSEPPIGGSWFYAGSESAGRPYIYLLILFVVDPPADEFQRIDALIDDGVLTSGRVVRFKNNLLYIVKNGI